MSGVGRVAALAAVVAVSGFVRNVVHDSAGSAILAEAGAAIEIAGCSFEGNRRDGSEPEPSGVVTVASRVFAMHGSVFAGRAEGPAVYGTELGLGSRIDGNTVVLRDAGNATRVRYCWGESPVCTVFDGSGLPAGPFEEPIR